MTGGGRAARERGQARFDRIGAVPLWSGRVGAALDPAVWELLRANDAELLPYDCEATAEHAARLHGAGLLEADELAEIEERLAEIAQDPSAILADDEDVHSAIERLLGPVGRKIHAGRSRNDQVAAALRLYVRDACAEAREEIDALALVTLSFAEAEADTLMPGYTHLQRGQPVTLGHHLLAWVEMLDRDRTRFDSGERRGRGEPARCGRARGLDPRARPARGPDAELDRRGGRPRLRARLSLRGGDAGAAPLPDRRGGRHLVDLRVRLPHAARERLHRIVDDAPEAQPRRRRARARQGGHRARASRRPARRPQGAASRIRPRSPGGQGARVRRPTRRQDVTAGDDGARERARGGSGSG